MQDLVPLLTQFGLTSKEALVYLELLPLGSTYASLVAQRLGMSRNLTRYLCQQLVKKGLCSESRKANAFIYTPQPPEKLAYQLSEEEKNLKKRRESLEAHMSTFQRILNPQEQLPQVKFLVGKEGFTQFCEASLACKSKEVLFVTYIEHFRAIMSEEYDKNYYIPTRIERGVHFKMLCRNTKVTRAMKRNDKSELRRTRFIPEDFPIESTFFVFDDKITFVSTEKQLNATMIQSTEISQMMRHVFDFMWSAADRS